MSSSPSSASYTSSPEKGAVALDGTTNQPVSALTRDYYLSNDFNPKHMNLIVQEGIILGGGAAAILLQVAEAGVGAGVNEHSNFAYRVQDRLRTTMTFVYAMSFGTAEEKRVITDMVTKVHTQVNGTLNEGRDRGRRYDAQDPHLQLWVAATLYATAIDTYQRIFGAIEDEGLMDRIYAEYAILACSLQVPPELWPATRADFWAYWDRKCAEIEITAHARSVAKDLLYLTHAPFYLRMLMPSVRCVTAELMPERIRAGYGVNRHVRMYKLHELMVKAMYRPLPLAVRSFPVRLYMKDMRKRLQGHKKVFDKA